MNILFLYSEIGPYNIAFFKELVKNYDVKVDVICWDTNKLKPYVPPAVENVTFYKRSTFDEVKLKIFLERIEYKLIYVSGWMDSLYLKFTQSYISSGIKVVCGFDDIWLGTLRQRLGVLYYRFFLSKYFTTAWVAGERQYEFARRLGFNSKDIIFDLLTADTTLFDSNIFNPEARKFVYVGNFRQVKGTDILVQAFKIYKKQYEGCFDLVCIGNGELEFILDKVAGLKKLPYMEQNEILEKLQECSCFILPSTHDQWGVVVHEFCAAGFPIILSTGVGAASKFLIQGFNGFNFENKNPESLARAMKIYEETSISTRIKMSENSKLLSTRVSPYTSAANFMSLVSEHV